MATAAVAGLPLDTLGEETTANKPPALPTRLLGRTGKKVTILNLGAGREPSNRLLNATYDMGVRYIDTADCYANGASEEALGKWMAKTGRRTEFCIVTKDHPRTPSQWVEMMETRLAALQTDYIDLFFIHALGEPGQSDADPTDIPQMKEWGAAAEKMKKTGKVHHVGFSTHSSMPLRIQLLNNAAKGGWVDAIMLSYDPPSVRDHAEFDKALDTCHKAGIGLICMKEMRSVGEVPRILPQFKEMGLTPNQAVLHAVWSDERIATICSAMPNLGILKENTTAARKFKPLDGDKVGAVMELYERHGNTFCGGCDGRCQKAGCTKAAISDIARYLTYHERDGMPEEARALFAALSPEQRDWHGADLAAASAACLSKLDFAALLARAEQKLA